MMTSAAKNSNLARLIMVFLIAAMTQSIVIGTHESVHAATCRIVGGEVIEFSALHVDCQPDDVFSTPTKIVSGSAAIVNIILGTVIYFVLRAGLNSSHTWNWFLWLLMLSNWSNGFGYLIFSGISGVGDYAVVIAGWEPAGLWQLGMLVVGGLLWFGAVWISLRVLVRFFGGEDKLEMRNRFLSLSIPSYFGAVIVIVCAGLLNKYGFLGVPSVAGVLAAAGTLSPLFWTPFWYTSDSFARHPGEALTLHFDLKWVIAAAIICLFYVVVLGSGFVLSP